MSAVAEWRIGGSTCAAAAGIHPYTSRAQLWLELTGRMERQETEAMRWGTLLEPVIASELERRGYEIMPLTAEPMRDPSREWCQGTPDGFVALDGHRALLSIKTANHWSHQHSFAEGVPIQYIAQEQWYMHLTGLTRGLLAVLVAGQRLELHELHRNQAAIDLLLTSCSEFVAYLRTDTPPPPDGSTSAREALAVLYPEATSGAVHRLLGREWDAMIELRQRRAQLAVIDHQVEQLEQTIKAAMGDAETAIGPADQTCVKWSNVTSRRIDTSALRKHRPEIAGEYERETTTRRFQVL